MPFVSLDTKISFFFIPYFLSVMRTNLSSLSHTEEILSCLGCNVVTWKQTRTFCLVHWGPGLTLPINFFCIFFYFQSFITILAMTFFIFHCMNFCSKERKSWCWSSAVVVLLCCLHLLDSSKLFSLEANLLPSVSYANYTLCDFFDLADLRRNLLNVFLEY